MSLLPLNSKVIDQNFAEIIDTRSRVDFSDMSIDPLTCDASLLLYIAFSKGANIDNMTEHESRLYLKTFNRKHIGTVGAVEDVSKVYFDIPKVIEWFNDDSLAIGEFSVNLKIVDKCRKFNEEKLEHTRKLVNDAKNVRSRLKEISLEYTSRNSSVMHTGFVAENSSSVEMDNKYSEDMAVINSMNIGVVCESFFHIKMGGL